jgi:hypothetical protein
MPLKERHFLYKDLKPLLLPRLQRRQFKIIHGAFFGDQFFNVFNFAGAK